MAVEAKHLPKRIDNMIKMFQDIKNTFKTRHRRGKGPKLVGVRTIESNFNAEKSTYNPHFNFIVETREMALILVEEWQKRLPKGYTTPKAQYYSSIENELQKLIEVIKYESKIFTEPDLNKKRKNQKVYALALYNILNAFKDHRLFGRFGFNGPKEAKKPNKLSVVVDYDIYHFDTTTANWIGSKGQKLTEFELNAHLEYLITEGVDMDLE